MQVDDARGRLVYPRSLMDHPRPTFELLRPSRSGAAGERGAASIPPPTIFGLTDRGNVRDNNEDQFLVAQLERAVVLEQTGFQGFEAGEPRRIVDEPSARLVMVADGMGGHEAGEVASSVVVDAMAHYAFAMMPWLGGSAETASTAEDLKKAVEHAQRRISQVAARKGLNPDLGTTLTMAYVVWPSLYLVHVGDSRAYLHRGGELFRLTRDHNLAGEMVRSRVLTEAQARVSRFTSVLTNAVAGSTEAVDVELHELALEPGDRLLLCTDGLYGEIEDKDIAARLDNVTGPHLVEPCARALVAAAKRAGGRDNVTAVLALF
jgi:protein phosphatase